MIMISSIRCRFRRWSF